MPTGNGDDRDVREAPPPFTWRVSRCPHNLFLCLLLILFELVLALGIYIEWGPYYAAFALVFLTLALLPFYGVYRYELDADHLRVYGPLYYVQYSWDEFASWRTYEDEVRLTFKGKPAHKVLVLYAPGRTVQVMTEVQRRMPPPSPDDMRI